MTPITHLSDEQIIRNTLFNHVWLGLWGHLYYLSIMSFRENRAASLILNLQLSLTVMSFSVMLLTVWMICPLVLNMPWYQQSKGLLFPKHFPGTHNSSCKLTSLLWLHCTVHLQWLASVCPTLCCIALWASASPFIHSKFTPPCLLSFPVLAIFSSPQSPTLDHCVFTYTLTSS